MRRTSWAVLLISAVLTLTACGSVTLAPVVPVPSGTAKVDILYLNHPPVIPVLDQVTARLKPYGDMVKVTRYDFDTPEGAAFAQKMGIMGHDPLAIFVNGSQSFKLDGRTVTFNSFPQGMGSGMVPDGAWTIDDFDAILKIVTGQ
jgi:hypothetical protein